jgi:outer membrane protein TolC
MLGACVAALILGVASSRAGNTVTNFITQPLSLAETVDVALRQNATILKAQTDLEAAEGVVIQTRAVALPKVGIIGDYGAVAEGDVDSPPQSVPGFTFGTEQSWRTQVRLTQSIYEGGRLASAFRAARLTRERSMLVYQTAVIDTVLEVEIAYYNVLFAEQEIGVQEASVDLLSRELTDTTRRYDAGTVPRFNVLRAEVELANARPKLIRARNAFRVTKNRLATLLGFNLPREMDEDIPLRLSGKLAAEPFELPLSQAIGLALERRTELDALRKTQALRQEDIVNARAGYKPSLQVFAGYDAHSSIFTPDLTEDVHGWIAGAQASWNIFDGSLTRGRVREAKAMHARSSVELDDAARQIELEVRSAFSNFIEAREVVESQKKVFEQAEEALRLARAREGAGTGTQLDVLSAQTALTDARSTQVLALREYSVARARLERAAGLLTPTGSEGTSAKPGVAKPESGK